MLYNLLASKIVVHILKPEQVETLEHATQVIDSYISCEIAPYRGCNCGYLTAEKPLKKWGTGRIERAVTAPKLILGRSINAIRLGPYDIENTATVSGL